LDTNASGPQLEATDSGSKPKRKQWERKANQYLEKALYVITEVETAGEILEPIEMRARCIMQSGH